MGLPADVAKAEIERYNELCHAGLDEDFGKMSKRMFPVENPPFYACKFASAGMLVLCGGIDCDLDMHALDTEDKIIPGLYVAGNTMGRRFLVEYPVVVAGISLGAAIELRSPRRQKRRAEPLSVELVSERAMAQPRALRLDNSLPERTHSAVRKTPANAILRLFRAFFQKTPSPSLGRRLCCFRDQAVPHGRPNTIP